MKLRIPPEKAKLLDRLPRKDRPPFSEVAAVQFFKLASWATVTGGIYLLQQRSGLLALKAVPYLVWLLIVWDMSAKLGYEPEVERTDGNLYVLFSRTYLAKLAFIALFSSFTAWAVVFWLAPLINKHGFATL